MTFVAGFYSFSIELNNSDRGAFAKFRLKLPRHELESREHFYARLIAFLHSYTEGLSFAHELSDPKLPTIWHTDAISNVATWIQVGVPEKRKLELSLKHHPHAEHRVYFRSATDDIQRFCHLLRGSRTNWVQNIEFYLIESALLESLEQCESSSSDWVFSCIDDRVYLTANNHNFEASITPIDIWSEFQRSLVVGQE
jgi:uncharacterized protein YaeQ